MEHMIAKELEKAQAELLRSHLSHLDLAENIAKASVRAAEQANADRLLNNLRYLDLAVRSQDALKAAHKALANAEEKNSAQKHSLNSASLFAKAPAHQNSPALFAKAASSKLEDSQNETTPIAPAA